MLKDRTELEAYLKKEIVKIMSNSSSKELHKQACDYIKDTYDMPRAITSDFLSGQAALGEADEVQLFYILDAIEKVMGKKTSVKSVYFVEREIKDYSKKKFKVKKIKFPLRFKMIQVEEDQWVGAINLAELMKLRRAQIINYNVDTQRPMTQIVRNGEVLYHISKNDTSIAEIKESYEDGTYIPTPYTLNIPFDTEYDFYYDSQNCELVIKSLKHFDILDGYHRYLAGCAACDLNKDFDYSMELRIVNFAEDKAKHFIHQEDKKNKIRKVDSDSFDMNKAANRVATRVNESSACNLKGLINLNKGVINYGDFANLVHYFYFKKTNKTEARKLIMTVSKELIENLNMLTEYDIKYLEKVYSYKQLCIVVYCFKFYQDKNKSSMCELIDEMVRNQNKLDNRRFSIKDFKGPMLKELEELHKEVAAYV